MTTKLYFRNEEELEAFYRIMETTNINVGIAKDVRNDEGQICGYELTITK